MSRWESIDKDIVGFLRNSGGEPFSHRGLWKAMNKKYNFRTIQNHLNRLANNPLSGIKRKQIGRAFIVWYGWELPLVDREMLDEMALNGQYPIHLIMGKIDEIAKPEDDGYFHPKRLMRESRESFERLEELILGAQKEILWWAGDFSTFDEQRDTIVESLKKGVDFKALMNIDLPSLNTAKKLAKLKETYSNLELRHWVSQWRGSIFDRKDVRLIQKTLKKEARSRRSMIVSSGKPGSDIDFIYKAWFIPGEKGYNLAHWVNWFCMVWDHHWEKAGKGPKAETVIETLEV